MEPIDIAEQAIADLSLDLLKVLLADRSTNKYILWATDNYSWRGEAYYPSHEITPELIIGRNTDIIQPRVSKNLVEQAKRTRDKGEVFTPSWVCNRQNNLVDDAWFGRSDVFNRMEGTLWTVNPEKVQFPKNKTWKNYVDVRRLEICCGEAPYLVSRYDAVSGKQIEILSRIGLLDRKLRVVNENTSNKEEWLKWTIRAFQSIYGYEYQGDNVLLARENLLLTFIDYYEECFGVKPLPKELKEIANIISWNIWQMDGITMTAPFSDVPAEHQQRYLSDMFGESEVELVAVPCKIYNWRSKIKVEFKSILKKGVCYND